MQSPSIYFLESACTESQFQKLNVIDVCYEAFSEGANDLRVIDIASSYTNSLVMEVLDNVKTGLLTLWQQILGIFNNYIVNSGNLVDKYRELLVEKYNKLETPITYHTYQYTHLYDKNYPSMIKSSNTLEKEIDDFEQRILDERMDIDTQNGLVDEMLINFAYDVVRGPVDPNGLKDSVRRVATDHIRGRQMIKTLKKEDLNKVINELCTYRAMRESLQTTKTDIVRGYDELKSKYSKIMKKKEAVSVGVKSISDPDFIRFNGNDASRFASINMSMSRMFSGFIDIYSESFNVKLEQLRLKMEENKALTVELMTKTGLFAAVNTKNPARYKAPQRIAPKVK